MGNLRHDEGNQDRFTDFMFGQRRDHRPIGRNISSPHRRRTSAHPTSIDFGELMMNIEALMESIYSLKPLLDKVYPFIEQIWKKK